MAQEWSYADLAPDQVELVDETERAMPDDIVVVYRPSAWGTVDPEAVAELGLHPDDLGPVQVAALQDLEARIGGVAVAYRRPAP